MLIDSFDTDKKVLIIAEIGNNHEGSYTLAEELVGLAARSGAGAVKFQTFKTEYFIDKRNKPRFEELKSFELKEKEFVKLSEYARKEGLLFLSAPFDLDSADFLKTIVSAFKIASGDNDFYPLIEKIALTGKPVIISSGFMDISGIKFAKSIVENTWKKEGIDQDLAVLHCISNYPVLAFEANLNVIPELKKILKCTVGYSDHTMGIDAPFIAALLGARIIEKHFTIDKNHSSFCDHKLSADPEDLRLLAEKIKNIPVFLGTSRKTMQKSEKQNIAGFRRSIAAKRDLKKGSKITQDDLMWTRPSGGLAPGKEKLVLGKTLSRSIKMGEHLLPEKL